ncbi:MAG: LysM peptidoglycan-binding domain-containing protein, partial [Sphingomonas bacterium]
MEHQRPAPPPVWETHAASADAHIVAAQTYIVRPGDSLGRIAERTGAGIAAIAASNGIAPPYPVRVGQRLTIPGGRYHLVRQGQTGIAIARAYGVPWSRIIAANGLTEPYILRAGQRILIPGEARASTAAERAAAFRLDIDDIITGGEPAVARNQRTPAPLPPPR